MIETTQQSCDSAAAANFETVRVLVLGYMAPVLFHEISNVLTVVSGIRQTCFRDDGEPAPAKVLAKLPHMIDEQARKSEALYEMFKRLAPRPASEKPCVTLHSLAEEVETFLELKVRGRRIRIERKTGGSDQALGADRVHRLKTVVLCLMFAVLDRAIRSHLPAEVMLATQMSPETGGEFLIEYRVRAGRDERPPQALDLDDTTLLLCRGLLARDSSAELRLQPGLGSIRLRFAKAD